MEPFKTFGLTYLLALPIACVWAWLLGLLKTNPFQRILAVSAGSSLLPATLMALSSGAVSYGLELAIVLAQSILYKKLLHHTPWPRAILIALMTTLGSIKIFTWFF